VALAALARLPRVERALLKLRGRPTSERYDSIHDALRHSQEEHDLFRT